jgi:hypothetical protein
VTGFGRALICVGLLLVAAGAVILAMGRIPLLGRLPGDIIVRRPGFTLYFPLATSLLLSGLLSLLFWFLRR